MSTRFKVLYALLLMLFTGLSLQASPIRTITLNGQWNLYYWPQPDMDEAITDPTEVAKMQPQEIKATVPGNVEIDLLAAGKIDDPMIGNNVNKLRKFENYQWCYSRKFATPETKTGEKVMLFFGGIDCLSDVWLNGKHLGSTANQMIEHSFDVTKLLKKDGSQNQLQVIIRSSVLEGQKYLMGAFSMRDGFGETVNIRKAASSFGWDIMPRLVSAGLWRDVELQIYHPIRFTDVFWITERVDLKKKSSYGAVDIQIRAPFEAYEDLKAVIHISRNSKTTYHHEIAMTNMSQRINFHLDNVDFWWPNGYGEAALYDAEISLQNSKGEVFAVDKRKIGIRTITLDRSEDNTEKDGRFCFIVNGEKIFVRGTNWVPLSVLHSQDASLVKSTVDMVKDLNCNMIRCWGGNVYEDHEFFNLCDQYGIMVWQDFAMACSFYPQNDEFAKKIEEEVRSVVLKLRSHPSLVLWSGNNENDESLLWSLAAFRLNPNRDRISRHVIPQVLYEFDPSRPYLPSSPYFSPKAYELGSNKSDLPELHLWGPRGYYKAPFYTAEKARFVSEIGYHGCPNLESLQKMFTKDCVYPWGEGLKWNDEWMTKAVRAFPTEHWTDMSKKRNDLMTNQIRLLFGTVSKKLEDFVTASQIVQAEAMKYFVERWRGGKFDKAGIIWWNVKDGWPIISDAVVDYYGSKKLAYHFIKNVQHNACVFINDAVDGYYPLIAVNDTREPKNGKVTVTDVISGKVYYKGDFSIDVNGKTIISQIPEIQGQGMLLIKYEIDGKSELNHYLYGQPPFDLNEYKKLLNKTGIYQTLK